MQDRLSAAGSLQVDVHLIAILNGFYAATWWSLSLISDEKISSSQKTCHPKLKDAKDGGQDNAVYRLRVRRQRLSNSLVLRSHGDEGK